MFGAAERLAIDGHASRHECKAYGAQVAEKLPGEAVSDPARAARDDGAAIVGHRRSATAAVRRDQTHASRQVPSTSRREGELAGADVVRQRWATCM